MERPTIKDVAREAGVSINTVSRALNGKPDVSPETRRQVLAVAERLNYMPNKLARGLRSNKTGIIGVVVADIANPFFSAVVKGMGKVAKNLGYSIIVGYDDIAFAFCLESPLTTIRVPKREIGEEVVSILAKKMNGDGCHSRLKMPVELVVRQSSLSTG